MCRDHELRVLGFGFWVLGFGFRVFGFGGPRRSSLIASRRCATVQDGDAEIVACVFLGAPHSAQRTWSSNPNTVANPTAKITRGQDPVPQTCDDSALAMEGRSEKDQAGMRHGPEEVAKEYRRDQGQYEPLLVHLSLASR